MNHPKDEYGRFICSKSNPMPKGAAGLWVHHDAHEVGEQEDGWPGGDIIRVKCDACGQQWKEELPQ